MIDAKKNQDKLPNANKSINDTTSLISVDVNSSINGLSFD